MKKKHTSLVLISSILALSMVTANSLADQISYPQPPKNIEQSIKQNAQATNTESINNSFPITIQDNTIFIKNAQVCKKTSVSQKVVYFTIEGNLGWYGVKNENVNNKYINNIVFSNHLKGTTNFWTLAVYLKKSTSININVTPQGAYINFGVGNTVSNNGLPLDINNKTSVVSTNSTATATTTATAPTVSTNENSQIPQLPQLESKILTVMPNIATPVYLSSSDINRISCNNADVKDVVFSQEKHLQVKTIGSNVFAKFMIEKKGNKIEYSDIPTEMYIVCTNGNVYNIIAFPKRIPAATVYLGGANTGYGSNANRFKGMPIEEKVSKIIRDIYLGKNTSEYEIKPFQSFKQLIYKDFTITPMRIIKVDSEGLMVREFLIKANEKVLFSEKDFVNNNYGGGYRIIAVALSNLLVYPGQTSKLFVVVGDSNNNGNE